MVEKTKSFILLVFIRHAKQIDMLQSFKPNASEAKAHNKGNDGILGLPYDREYQRWLCSELNKLGLQCHVNTYGSETVIHASVEGTQR